MGWIDETHPSHEGFLVGWRSARQGTYTDDLKELKCPRHGETSQRNVKVSAVQMACSCGWRSALLRAPLGTVWHPCMVFLDKHDEDNEANRERELMIGPTGRSFELRCYDLWKAHLVSLADPFIAGRLYLR